MLHPTHKTGLKLLCIQPGKDQAKGVMRWDSVRESQHRFQPVLIGVSKLFCLDPVIRSAYDCTDCDNDDVAQLMKLCAFNPGIFQILKMLNQ